MVNQEFKEERRKYQVLPNLGISCREQRGLKVKNFRAWVRSFCSVHQPWIFPLKGLGHVTINKPVTSSICIVLGTCLLFDVHILMDGMNP